MSDPKHIKILKTFSEEEIKSFKRFLSSPFFNSNKNLIELFKIISAYYPGFEKLPDKLKVSEKIWGEDKKEENVKIRMINNLSTDLTKSMMDFLAVENFLSKKENYSLNLMENLNEKNLFDLFDSEYNALVTDINSRQQNSETYMNRYLAETLYIVNLNKRESLPYHKNENAQNIADNLIRFFLSGITRVYNYMLFQSKNAYSFTFRYDFLEQLKEHFKKHDYSEYGNIDISFNALKLQSLRDNESFQSLKDSLYKNHSSLTRVEARNMFILLTNFCFTKYNSDGDADSLSECHDLYCKMIEIDLYKPSGFINHLDLKNICRNALSIGLIDWTVKFIKEHSGELDTLNRNQMPLLMQAWIELYKKNYNKALELTASLQNPDFTYKIDIKCIQLLIYLERKDIDSVNFISDSFRHLISNSKEIRKELADRNSAFIKYVRRILTAMTEYNKAELFVIRKEMISMDLNNKKYLLDKLQTEIG